MTGHHLSVALLGLMLCAGTVLADEISLTPVKDNTLFESETGSLSSGSGTTVFVGANGSLLKRRALLAFDVAAALPADAIVETVELQLTVSNAQNDTPRDVTVHAVLADWGEGASASTGGGGAPAMPGDATWLHRFTPDSLWASAGGDYDPAPLATTAVAGIGPYTWSGAALAADVQRWIDDPAASFGWILTGEETVANSARRIDSREADPATRPALVITYHRETPVREASWGGVKERFQP